MKYFKTDHTFPINIMIIDDQSAVFGFRKREDEEKTSLSVVVEANSPDNIEFIKGLIQWYENILMRNTQQIETDMLLKQNNKY